MKLLALIYTAFLHLYPSGFRSEFAGEMQDVFVESLQEAARRGRMAIARLFLREIGSIPSSLVREGWTGFWSWFIFPWQNSALSDIDTAKPGSWLAAAFAGLPHLLFALSLFMPRLVAEILGLQGPKDPALPVFWAMVAIALLYARRRGWPRWSSSWIGYSLAFLLDLISQRIPTGWPAYLTGILWLCITALVLLWLARRDWISGLMAVLPISPMWLWPSLIGQTPVSLEAASLCLSISLILTAAVIAIVRLGRWQTALLILLALILSTGMPFSLNPSFPRSPGLDSQAAPAPWYGADGWLVGYVFVLILTAPLWLMAFWHQTQRRQALGTQ